MAKKKDKDFLGEEWESFRQEYEKADDRSCALLGAAYLDNCLEIVLLRALHHPDEAKKGLLGEMMPLGTFSAKIKMAFCQLFPLCPKPQQSRGFKNDVSQTLLAATGDQ